MNVLLISPLPPPAGGIATWTKLFLDNELVKKNSVDLIDIAVKGNRANNFASQNTFEELRRNLNIIIALKRKIKDKHYDIVHINTSCSTKGMLRDIWCVNILKRKHCKIVLQCHCNVKNGGCIHHYLLYKLLGEADTVFTLNTVSQKYINESFGLNSVIIPNFLNVKTTAKKAISDTIKNIIFVGHVLVSKGCNEIIEIANVFPNIQFKLIGNISDEYKNKKISSNVKLVGEVDQESVYQEMMAADALLFPSYSEGFPLVILEAMSLGLPIIATPVGAIPDMIEHEGGIQIRVENIEDIHNAILKINDKQLRLGMSNWNINKVKQNYSDEIVVGHIFDIYSELIN